MEYTEHSSNCQEITKRIDALRKDFLTRFPHACQSCGAYGFRYYGGDYENPPEIEYCNDCTNQNKCPRCGNIFIYMEDAFDIECLDCVWSEVKVLEYPDSYEFLEFPIEAYCWGPSYCNDNDNEGEW